MVLVVTIPNLLNIMNVKSKVSIRDIPISDAATGASAHSSFSRRNFIRAIGLASGAVAAAPMMPNSVGKAVARTILGIGSPMKIGVILDRMNPRAADFMKGLQLYTKQLSERRGGHQVEIIAEETGHGLHSQMQIAEKLIAVDEVSFVFVTGNPRSMAPLEDLFNRSRVPLIEISAGEVIPKRTKPSPYVFRSTLNLWQAHTAMGYWAATNVGKRAAVTCSLFNAGFDMHRGFIAGFEEAGGEIVKIFVTGGSNGQHPFGIMEPIKALDADLVYGSYSGYDALVFAQAYNSSGVGKPLFGTNLYMANPQKTSLGNGEAMYYTTPWSASLTNQENASFGAAYHAFCGSDPNAFATLGYDSARIALTAAEQVNGNCRTPAFIQAMHRTQVNGLRGEIRMDAETNTVLSPFYMVSSQSDHAIKELSAREASHALMYHQNATALTSGWTNRYHDV
jgi:branched-chain amino acid transport system substrate-binding protein